jgi:hypothetical protein
MTLTPGGGTRRNTDAFCRNLLAVGAVLGLVVEPHHPVELQVLEEKENVSTCGQCYKTFLLP